MYVCLYFFCGGASTRFRAMASPVTFRQPPLVLADALPSRIWSEYTVSPSRASSLLPLGFTTGILSPKCPLLCEGFGNHLFLLRDQPTTLCLEVLYTKNFYGNHHIIRLHVFEAI